MVKRLGLIAVVLCFLMVGAKAYLTTNARRAPKPLVITTPTRRPSKEILAGLFPSDSRRVFEQGDHFVLYSIDPLPSASVQETFHGYPVKGKTEIKDLKIRRALIAHFYSGMADEIHPAGCFEPHHAIRSTKGGKTIDVVMCFGCSGIVSYYGKSTGGGYVSGAPNAFFNAVLDNAGIAHH